ncbi:ATP-dependent helicase [Porphyrobacter sp. SLTP]|uniref:DISARM system SNF2-like helicase DrmD n=1 Tax=Porphyrobacter sp. SLTP TaxID=2683266 RepID=UPI001412BC27|nr:DISARM system SNF2-like helicase DrmD [Porphyrobacter sp. SLTP]NBB24803.1 ATP-dependent helicase [Porphyrobacter sp. SLTP]NBB24874.1 ATP-dependent helicase [Porphyrobacter sp. SLTP]
MKALPKAGEFVDLRGRLWLVEEQLRDDPSFPSLRLSCVDDDAQGEIASIIWDTEIAARSRDDELWDLIGDSGTDDAKLFAAYLRTIRWNSSTASDRELFQAPFRAGIRMDAYQLAPLKKALQLPRVNLLIADDVGLGKTIEAGLVVREMLLRKRIDFIVVLAPPSMTIQWQDELAAKFGLSFEIIDRDLLAELRRKRGFGVNPWAAGSRFILSHKLLGDEAYTSGLREILGSFQARSLLILDEAHHCAPAGGGRYAIESQFTKAVRDIADRFEHRLFLSATPHNGHANSFATLLEILDPQRFTRGMDVREDELKPVMVRRLKADLRALGEAFPERIVERVALGGLREDQPELVLAKMLSDYGALRERRIGALRAGKAAQARLSFVGLQQRLLSSIPAFAKTLQVHRKSLQKVLEQGSDHIPLAAAAAFVHAQLGEVDLSSGMDEDAALRLLSDEEDQGADAAAALGTAEASRGQLDGELAAVDAMIAVSEKAATSADARIEWLEDWINGNMVADGQWGERRLIIFTEYEATRIYIERQLRRIIMGTPDHDSRIATFTGITSSERREAIKRAFNDADSFLRILICTDAAREGINLQQQCHDLVHFDLPWNPSRLEQRNGRIDRKLQPAPQVFCRYFVYEQRPEDIVLEALVRKTDLIQRQLGSAGQVIENRVARRMADRGILRSDAKTLAAAIASEEADEKVNAAVQALGDQPNQRLARIKDELDDLKSSLEAARKRVGVDSHELEAVFGLALSRAGADMGAATAKSVQGTRTFALSPDLPTFTQDQSWQPVFDELRERRQKPGERPGQWRTSEDAQVRRISFSPAIDEQGRDAPGVVQVHVEHRLVRRLLSRFLTTGFQSGLNRACVIRSAGTGDRAVLLGRLALYGPNATRLHEEIIPIAADWIGSEGRTALQPLAASDEAGASVIAELEAALHGIDAVPERAIARFTPGIHEDVLDLRVALEAHAQSRRTEVEKELTQRGKEEASALRSLLKSQIDRIRSEQKKDDRQLTLDFDEQQTRQRDADRKSWEKKLERLTHDLETEPERLRNSFDIRAARIEPLGMVYLWAGEEG